MTTDFTQAELTEFLRVHDFDNPMSELSRLEAVGLSVKGIPPCHHCSPELRVRPMTGTGWCVEHLHQPGCPDDD